MIGFVWASPSEDLASKIDADSLFPGVVAAINIAIDTMQNLSNSGALQRTHGGERGNRFAVFLLTLAIRRSAKRFPAISER
jgi:hypothetical protein